MADYLTRLVERILQLSPTVRPDLQPTFAPERSGPPPPDPAEESTPHRNSSSRTAGRDYEERYSASHSTAGYQSRQPGNAGERAVREHPLAGDDPEGKPEEPGRRSSPAPPDFPEPVEATEKHAREPEAPEYHQDHRGATSSDSPAGTQEKIGYTHERPEIARPAERPADHTPPSPREQSGEPQSGRWEGEFRGGDGLRSESDPVTSSGRRDAGLSDARVHAVATVPGRREIPALERSVRERPAAPDLFFPDTARPVEDSRPAESSSPAIDAREHPDAVPNRTEPERTPRAQRRPRDKERTPPRTVRVTIGRVEVRAVPPEQPLPEPKPVPGLSLDDYLRRHNEARK